MKRLRLPHQLALFGLCALLTTALAPPSSAQQLEPRRWSHLPTGLNFAGVGYAYTEADISDKPAFRLQDVKMELHTLGGKYIRTFDLLGKSARIDLIQGYQKGRWQGLLGGAPGSAARAGYERRESTAGAAGRPFLSSVGIFYTRRHQVAWMLSCNVSIH